MRCGVCQPVAVSPELLDEDALAALSVVANCAMNRVPDSPLIDV
jgi:hypothetical protein